MASHDGDTFRKRLSDIWNVIKPSNLFVTDQQLAHAVTALKAHRDGRLVLSSAQVHHYQGQVDSTLHPDTGEKIWLPLRMASFVPTNLIVTAGLLIPGPSLSTLLFWQVANQTVNVAITHANANKTAGKEKKSQTAAAFFLAVLTSCGVASSLHRMAARPSASPWLVRLAPFTAVAAASVVNVTTIRWKELADGVYLSDQEGVIRGRSTVAGQRAVAQVVVSRILTAMPVLVLTPMLMSLLDQSQAIRARPRVRFGLQLGLISSLLMTALPCALALFPRTMRLDVRDLEPRFKGLVLHGAQTPVEHLYCNKGL